MQRVPWLSVNSPYLPISAASSLAQCKQSLPAHLCSEFLGSIPCLGGTVLRPHITRGEDAVTQFLGVRGRVLHISRHTPSILDHLLVCTNNNKYFINALIYFSKVFAGPRSILRGHWFPMFQIWDDSAHEFHSQGGFIIVCILFSLAHNHPPEPPLVTRTGHELQISHL